MIELHKKLNPHEPANLFEPDHLLAILGTILFFVGFPLAAFLAVNKVPLVTNAQVVINSESSSSASKFLSNEILIKVKKEFGDKVREGNPHDSGLPSLNNLNSELGVIKFEKVFKEEANRNSDLFRWYKITLPGRGKFLNGNLKSDNDNSNEQNSEISVFKNRLRKFANDLNIEIAQPNFVLHTSDAPNDPFYSSNGSWGQPYPDLWGAKKINPEPAWNIATGSASLSVAVVDSGVDRNHEDLRDNMWINSWETPNNSVDDDNNGFRDDYNGWDFTTCEEFDQYGFCIQQKSVDNDPVDDHGHGTHVAGTIGAVGNNGVGVVGVTWEVNLMAVKALNKQGIGKSSELAAAMAYVVNNGARIINNSWGCRSPCYDPLTEEASRDAYNRGVVVVFAAGNSNDDVSKYSPLNLPGIIVAAATDPNDSRASFSNFGWRVDVAAPGVDILSTKSSLDTLCLGTTVGGQYCRRSGTSMAAPHVAGVAALVLTTHPSFTPEEVRQVLRASTDDVGVTGFDIYSGRGRINAGRALTVNSVLKAEITNPAHSTGINYGDSVSIIGTAAGPGFVNYQLSYGVGTTPTGWLSIGSASTRPVTNGLLGVWQLGPLVDNQYYILKLAVTDSQGFVFDTYVPFYKERWVKAVTANVPYNQTTVNISDDKIVWEDYRNKTNYGSPNIFLYDLSTNTERQITTGLAGQYHPAVSGNKIVWDDRRNGNADIYLYDLSANTERSITTDLADQGWPAISGDKIVWQDWRNGNSDIYLYDLVTNIERQITTDSANQRFPSISGDKIVWGDERYGPDVYLYDLTTNTERRITTSSAFQYMPTISGDRIVWYDFRNGNADIYLYDLSTSTERQITSNPAKQYYPVISGNKIVWQDERNGNLDVYLYDLSTSTERQLLPNPANQKAPVISGERIVWVDNRYGANDLDVYLYDPPYADPNADTDKDGCKNVAELGSDPLKGGRRDPYNPWDFYDVPVPAIGVGGRIDGTKDKAVNMSDVSAVLYYFGTFKGGPPNNNGVDYDNDLNRNGVSDGEEYDRTPSSDPNQLWRTGPPNGAINMSDVGAVLAQVSHSCRGP